MSAIRDQIAHIVEAALESGLAHPYQRNFIAIEGELDLDELACHIAGEVETELGMTEFECDGERWWSTKFCPVEES